MDCFERILALVIREARLFVVKDYLFSTKVLFR